MTELETAVLLHVQAHAARYGLDRDRISVVSRLNWSGFVNASFRVGDGTRRLHLKLGSEGGSSLTTFFQAAGILHGRYCGPRALAWIDMPATGYAGILFEEIAADPPEAISPVLVREIADALDRLRRDEAIRRLLTDVGHRPVPCRHTYDEVYGRRFASELAVIAAQPPPFVDAATCAFMDREVRALAAEVAASPAFDEVVNSPIHADIWTNNVLIDGNGGWHLIDWDDIAIGDPALDLAMLLDGAETSTRIDDSSLLARALPPAEARRIALYRRARMLDEAIDALADWIEAGAHPRAGAHPAWIDEVRARKERTHRTALERYRRL